VVFGLMPARRAAPARSGRGAGRTALSHADGRPRQVHRRLGRRAPHARAAHRARHCGRRGGGVLLTSIGEGVRQFVVAEFTQFGTNIVNITPGTTKTMGGSIGVSAQCRPLTIDDAESLRRVPYMTGRCRWCRQRGSRGQRPQAPRDGLRRGARISRMPSASRSRAAASCRRTTRVRPRNLAVLAPR